MQLIFAPPPAAMMQAPKAIAIRAMDLVFKVVRLFVRAAFLMVRRELQSNPISGKFQSVSGDGSTSAVTHPGIQGKRSRCSQAMEHSDGQKAGKNNRRDGRPRPQAIRRQ